MKPTYLFAFAYRGKPHLDKFQAFPSKKALIAKLQWYQEHGTRDQRMDLSEHARGGYVALETMTTPEGEVTSRSIKKEVRAQIKQEDHGRSSLVLAIRRHLCAIHEKYSGFENPF